MYKNDQNVIVEILEGSRLINDILAIIEPHMIEWIWYVMPDPT